MTKPFNGEFKRSVYWNSYGAKPAKVIEQGKNIYKLPTVSFQGVKRLFVLAYFIAVPNAGGNTDETAGKKAIKSFFYQKEKLKITMYYLMEEIFLINQLMT